MTNVIEKEGLDNPGIKKPTSQQRPLFKRVFRLRYLPDLNRQVFVRTFISINTCVAHINWNATNLTAFLSHPSHPVRPTRLEFFSSAYFLCWGLLHLVKSIYYVHINLLYCHPPCVVYTRCIYYSPTDSLSER